MCVPTFPPEPLMQSSHEHEAATHIGAMFKGFMLRKNLPALKLEQQRKVTDYRAAKAAKQEQAASTIQASFRGHKARKSFFATPEGHAFSELQKARVTALKSKHESGVEELQDGKTIADQTINEIKGIPMQSDSDSSRPSSSKRKMAKKKKTKGKTKGKKKKPDGTNGSDDDDEADAISLGPDPDANLPAPKTLMESYARYQKAESRRKEQDRILLKQLMKPLGKFVDWKEGLGSSDVAMLAHTQHSHLVRLSASRKKDFIRQKINAAKVIQAAWRTYAVKRDEAEEAGVPLKSIRHFKTKKYRDLVGSNMAQASAHMNRKANPAAHNRQQIMEARRRNRAKQLKLPSVSGKSYKWATDTRVKTDRRSPTSRNGGKGGSVGKGRRSPPSIGRLAQSSKKTNVASGTTRPLALKALGGSLPMSPVSVESLRIQRVIRAEAAATRTRLRKGWNDDPRYIPERENLPRFAEPRAAKSSRRRLPSMEHPKEI